MIDSIPGNVDTGGLLSKMTSSSWLSLNAIVIIVEEIRQAAAEAFVVDNKITLVIT